MRLSSCLVFFFRTAAAQAPVPGRLARLVLGGLVAVCLLAFPLTASSGHFLTVDVKDGLADNFVRDITTDSEGYVWISTINGLSRYDGYRFLNFHPQQWGGHSGDVTMVRETADGTLWMLCCGELLTYRRSQQTWQKDGMQRLRQMGIQGSSMSIFYVDDRGGLWTVTEAGLYHQDFLGTPSPQAGGHPPLSPADSPTQAGGQLAPARRMETGSLPILHIVAKNGTTLVVTTDYNIYKVCIGGNAPLSPQAEGQLELLAHAPATASLTATRDSRAMLDSRMNLWLYRAHCQAGSLWAWSLVSGEWFQPEALIKMGDDVTVNALAEDRDGRIWVGTGNQGISVIDWHGNISIKDKTMIHVSCLYADRNNTVWAGSGKLGAAYADLNSPEFILEPTEGFEDVSALMEDAEGNLWIGSDGKGIIVRRRAEGGLRMVDGGKGENTLHFSLKDGTLPSDNVTAIHHPQFTIHHPQSTIHNPQSTIHNPQSTLVGTYGGGIARFDGKRFSPLFPDCERLRYVKDIVSDRHGTLWVATVDKGVARIVGETFTWFTTANSPLLSDGIICLEYDSRADRLYIGTSRGMASYDCSQDRFIEDNGADSLRNVYVNALLADSKGRLWIGSRSGLWMRPALPSGWPEKGQPLTHLTTEQGMTNNVVRALAAGAGIIWASTDNGLTAVTMTDDGAAPVCRPFFDSDGLHGIVFSNNAALTTREGEVLLGCLTGCVCIPQENKYAAQPPMLCPPPRVRFTEFRINGQTVVKSPEGFDIEYGERLGVAISVMVPSLSGKARYLYRFKGEEEWMRAPNNILYFASLIPGTHVLQVKAELPGMMTTEVSELTFGVLPPPWLSKWAMGCYLLLLAAAVGLVWRAMRRRQKRELAMKQMELNLKKYEMEEQKISFFTNISHDIKTPLTMVMAPLEKIRDASLPAAVRTEIDVAWQNARQLYDLVLELLDFRRLDEGKEKLTLNHGELVSFVRRTAQGFNYIASRRNITMELRLPATPVEMLFDENKMRRIIINLLSNACKYNVEGGSVVVTLTTSAVGATISVADTGIGVKDKRRIFDRFAQETHGQEQEGSGLGLHIVRQYVDMMGGSITADDNEPRGTVFTVTLPIMVPNTDDEAEAATAPAATDATPTILVVEDNTDARLFLQRSLEDEYHVLTAANGREALGQLAKAGGSVNIIISDVMMPVMDGMELVRQIRKDIHFSHIPVILLTAKSSEEDIIAGLREGAEEYLTKPFSLTVLRLRIRRILERTRLTHEQVATGIEIKASDITVSSLDEEFIGHVIAEVEANISDQNYSVVQLSTAVSMTRGTLYKKLMAIVGKSPVEFIRIVRLKRGKSLLDQGRTNVSEVADRVGISPKMFAQYFREMYGCTPSDYLRQRKSLAISSLFLT